MKTLNEAEIELLRSIYDLLKQEGFQCTWKEKDLIRAIYFPIRAEQPEQELIEVRAWRQIDPTSNVGLASVQFLVHLGIAAQPQAVVEVALFLAMINRLLAIPGFEMDMSSYELYYRYVLYGSLEGIHTVVLRSLVGFIIYLIEVYGEPLKELAMGKKTYRKLMDEFAQISQITEPPMES